jgi:UDPglucose 6-dehydrogenase
MKITMIGTGYVGLVSAACFAEMGHFVTCLDIDVNKIAMLNQGKIPIYEPHLEELVVRLSKAKRLFFTIDPACALHDPEICFIAVPTQSAKTGEADLKHVFSAMDTLIEHLQKETLVVIKSTVPIGTTKKTHDYLQQGLIAKNKRFAVDVTFSPEFLKEGSAVNDFMKPDRIIIGATRNDSIEKLKQAFSPFTQNHNRILVMKPESAEMTKYAANVMLASRISLMNEFANFCEKVGANIHDVRVGIGSDQRIGYHFLYAGAGFGGSCFPKDIRALKAMMIENGIEPKMIQAIEQVNHEQKLVLLKKLHKRFPSFDGLTFTLLGLSFKPDTDDIREASSIVLIQELLQYPVHLKLFDPIAQDQMKKLFPPSEKLSYEEDEYQALQNSDALILVTEWKQFRQLNFSKIAELMRTKVVIDGRNQYHPDQLQSLGFYYDGIGVVGFGNTE